MSSVASEASSSVVHRQGGRFGRSPGHTMSWGGRAEQSPRRAARDNWLHRSSAQARLLSHRRGQNPKVAKANVARPTPRYSVRCSRSIAPTGSWFKYHPVRAIPYRSAKASEHGRKQRDTVRSCSWLFVGIGTAKRTAEWALRSVLRSHWKPEPAPAS